ncbi:MAG: carboxymuconolactone decarboxylase family protein [Desulfobacterales bacterium]
MGIPKPLKKDQADVSITEIFDGMHAALGKMPNIFGVLARFPAALKRFVPFYNAVMLKGRIPAKLKEIAYLKTASINACQYCLRAHTASAKQAGVTDQQIEELRFYRNSPAFDEKEKATIRFADLVTRGAATIDESVLTWIGRFYTEDEIVELVMVIALANMVNRFNDTLQIEPDLG